MKSASGLITATADILTIICSQFSQKLQEVSRRQFFRGNDQKYLQARHLKASILKKPNKSVKSNLHLLALVVSFHLPLSEDAGKTLRTFSILHLFVTIKFLLFFVHLHSIS